jgi:hypothetical protein
VRLDLYRVGAAADAVARLAHEHVAAGSCELVRGDEAGESGPHDDDVGLTCGAQR